MVAILPFAKRDCWPQSTEDKELSWLECIIVEPVLDSVQNAKLDPEE